MYVPPNLGSEPTQSLVSIKDDSSMYVPPNLGSEPTQSSQFSETNPMSPSPVFIKRDSSMYMPPNLGSEPTQSCGVCGEASTSLFHLICGHWSCKQCVGSEWNQSNSPENFPCLECGKKSKKTSKSEEDIEETSGGSCHLEATKEFKEEMKKKYSLTSEGNGDQPSSLDNIYTELLITTGENEGPHAEHEFKTLTKHLKKRQSFEQTVHLNDVFKPLPGEEKTPRIVLTKGIAGIGKSFTVQKFILDWAKEKANQDVDFIFIFAFRELNLITEEMSLHGLLTLFHPVYRILKDTLDFTNAKMVLIFDGLDESRFKLDFESKTVTSVSEVTSVGNLLVNLIKGSLLPEAKLWIMSRPVAANQIPPECVDMVTEIRGFSDPQKEEYFRRRLTSDSDLAKRIISHMQSSQSLDVMCQIPIFCWIFTVLFKEIFKGDKEADISQTLTEMMGHFLFAQTKRSNRKYTKTEQTKHNILEANKEFLLKLGKLAFDQLLKNNLVFYKDDLEACGIDIEETSIYSGFCSTVFRERIFFQKKVFFFGHLTIQEFFAALYVYDCFVNNNITKLGNFLDLKDEGHSLLVLLKMTVDKVLKMKNGHLDFFLGFLLGLMVEPNQRVLQGLLTSLDQTQETDKKILTHLKSLRRKTLSPDSCINIFQVMVEMKDHKVKDDIEDYLKLSEPSKAELNPLHCSALAYMLQVSKKHLDLLDLKNYNTSEEGRRRLIPAVRSSKKALLADCKVTAEWVEHLAFGLTFPFSPLRDLDLSNNDLRDSGVELLCKGLSSQQCRLQTLRLSGCLVTESGCDYLASALKSNPSHLRVLDLSYNNLGQSGEKLLSDLNDDPQNKLNNLRINTKYGGIHRMKPGFKKYAVELTFDLNTAHRNLLLSEGNRKVSWVEEEQPYPPHRDRFEQCQQVLCEKLLMERCYMELEVSESFCIGLTYKSICRKGDKDDCKLGHNNSWCFICSDEGCYVQSNKGKVPVFSTCSRFSRVGVYLDYEDNTLSFYRVSSDTRTHLYTFREDFSEALHPAVGLHKGAFATICQLS
ncbi:NLR family CARD domain-containing protein 3-like isoform 3-T3 [Pholidichthys leucotaenia]